MPACISKVEKSKSEKRCQESGLNEFTDWEGTDKAVLAHVFGSRGILPPTPPPQALIHPLLGKLVPHSVQNQLQEREALWFSEHGEPPAKESGPTFHTHAVIEAFVVEASVVGCAEMLPQVAASPCQHREHAQSAAPSRPSPQPCTPSYWTRNPSSLWQAMPWRGGPSGVQGSWVEPQTDVMAEAPKGRRQRPQLPQIGN